MTEDRTVIASLPTEGRGAKQSHGSKATRERKDQSGVFPSYSVPSLSQAGDPDCRGVIHHAQGKGFDKSNPHKINDVGLIGSLRLFAPS